MSYIGGLKIGLKHHRQGTNEDTGHCHGNRPATDELNLGPAAGTAALSAGLRRLSGCGSIAGAGREVVACQELGNGTDNGFVRGRLRVVVLTVPAPGVEAGLAFIRPVVRGVAEGPVGEGAGKTSGPGFDGAVESQRPHAVVNNTVGLGVLVGELELRSSVLS